MRQPLRESDAGEMHQRHLDRKHCFNSVAGSNASQDREHEVEVVLICSRSLAGGVCQLVEYRIDEIRIGRTKRRGHESIGNGLVRMLEVYSICAVLHLLDLELGRRDFLLPLLKEALHHLSLLGCWHVAFLCIGCALFVGLRLLGFLHLRIRNAHSTFFLQEPLSCRWRQCRQKCSVWQKLRCLSLVSLSVLFRSLSPSVSLVSVSVSRDCLDTVWTLCPSIQSLSGVLFAAFRGFAR